MYCPNCSADLAGRDIAEGCGNCGAQFGSGSAWKPVASPLGAFRKFAPKNPSEAASAETANPTHPLLEVLFRLFLGIVIWIAVGALALLSAVPYGGGIESLIVVWQFATLLLPAWALWPLGRLFSRKKIQAKPSEES